MSIVSKEMTNKDYREGLEAGREEYKYLFEVIAVFEKERIAMIKLLKDFRDNYDCDIDAHNHGYADSQCRCCKADAFLESLKPKD